jgi:glutamate/tyrosine decarboxylase-like PLP-dependent enzyme
MLDPLVDYRDPARSRESVRRLGHASVEAMLDYFYDEAMRRPIAPESYAEFRARYAPQFEAPAAGRPAGEVLAELRSRILPYCMNAAHPRAFCYFTAPPLLMAVMGDLIASAINQSVDIWVTSPVAAFAEEEVVRWLCGIAGYGPDSFGILTSGGMNANLTALKVARDRRIPDRHAAGALQRARLYASSQTHFSMSRSLDVLGFPPETLRPIACDGRYRLRVDALEAAIRADAAAGLHPFCVVANAGTTNTGSVDPIVEVAEVAARHGLWLHVDAAYGGAARLSQRHANRVTGLDRCDSVTLDPHKLLFQPHDIGAVLFRRGEQLLESFRSSPEYYRTGRPDEEPLHWYQFGIEGSRRFRGLKLWMSWKHLGSEGLGALVDRTLELATCLAQRIGESDDFEATPPVPDLSVVCFRHRPAGLAPGDALDRHQDRLQRALEVSGEGWLSTTRLDGATWLRAGVVNYLSVPADVDRLLESLRRLGGELCVR